MRRLIIITLILLTAACVNPKRGDPEFAPAMPQIMAVPKGHTNAIYQDNSTWLLYEDIKARRVGDMVVVTLDEKTNAQKKTGTTTSKVTDVATKATLLAGAPVASLNNSYKSGIGFTGTGDSSQSNKLSGTIAVTVKKVLPNGNLVVQGEKWITINQGKEYVRIRGIIRPTDIDPDNTISSTRVANAQIQYGGEGSIADSSSMGWLSRFFNSSWMPF